MSVCEHVIDFTKYFVYFENVCQIIDLKTVTGDGRGKTEFIFGEEQYLSTVAINRVQSPCSYNVAAILSPGGHHFYHLVATMQL